ncbi:hypothetical protein LZ30DRAFT_813806 [Colletotrichum cereale]|nr:hypothetical protein LZ30DRAFT_813806 [Colletotrichum cereale]
MPLPKSILIFNEIIEEVARCAGKLADIRSPAHKHQDGLEAIRSTISVARERVLRATHTTERDQLQVEIQGYSAKLEELQQGYELGLEDAWAEYERRADSAVTALCEALDESAGTLLGPRARRDYETQRYGAPSRGSYSQDVEVSLRPYYPDAARQNALRYVSEAKAPEIQELRTESVTLQTATRTKDQCDHVRLASGHASTFQPREAEPRHTCRRGYLTLSFKHCVCVHMRKNYGQVKKKHNQGPEVPWCYAIKYHA